MSRERAEQLAEILAGAPNWPVGSPRLRVVPRTARPNFSPSSAVSAATPSYIEFERRSRPWLNGKEQFEGSLVIAEGIIVEAAYRDAKGQWRPLPDQIGEPAPL